MSCVRNCCSVCDLHTRLIFPVFPERVYRSAHFLCTYCNSSSTYDLCVYLLRAYLPVFCLTCHFGGSLAQTLHFCPFQIVKVFGEDGTRKVVEIPADMTARDLCQLLVYKSHCLNDSSWALLEHHPVLGLGKGLQVLCGKWGHGMGGA